MLDLLLAHAASQPVRTQLCLAVAALVAHMPPERWAPSGSVAWLVQHLSKDGKEGALPCLLDLLAILPEVRLPCKLLHAALYSSMPWMHIPLWHQNLMMSWCWQLVDIVKIVYSKGCPATPH